jgi:hypothetical protein
MMFGPCRGGAVRLAEVSDLLMVGEGVETTLSEMQATGLPGWATARRRLTSPLRGLGNMLNGARSKPAPDLQKLEPPLPAPKPQPKKPSKLRAAKAREIQRLTGRSSPWARQLLTIIEIGNTSVIAQVLTHKVSVHRAVAMVDPELAHDRELLNKFRTASRELREELVSLID